MSQPATEDERWHTFKELFRRGNESIFKKNVTYMRIQQMFPNLLNEHIHKNNLKQQHTSVRDYFLSKASESISELCKQYEVESHIHELGTAIRLAEERKARFLDAEKNHREVPASDLPINLSSMSPRDLMACYLQKTRLQQCEAVDSESQALEDETRQVEEQIRETKRHVEKLRGELKGTCDRINKFSTLTPKKETKS